MFGLVTKKKAQEMADEAARIAVDNENSYGSMTSYVTRALDGFRASLYEQHGIWVSNNSGDKPPAKKTQTKKAARRK